MGLLEKLKSGPTRNNQSLENQTPATRAGAFNTSQMHAQGSMGDEAPGFGKINNEFIASNPIEASNLKFKNSKSYSELDLDGLDQGIRDGALTTSQLHSQGNNTETLNPTTFKQKNATNLNFKSDVGQSKFDLDGLNPGLRAGALNTSQLHSQGVNTEALNPTTTKLKDATNLNFKSDVGQSKFDLDGKLPATGTYRDNAPEGKQF